MKHIISIVSILVLFPNWGVSQNKYDKATYELPNEYNAVMIDVGNDRVSKREYGNREVITKLFKIMGVGRNTEEAISIAKKNAVAVMLIGEIKSTSTVSGTKPLIDLNKVSANKSTIMPANFFRGDHLKYIEWVNTPSFDDLVKVAGGTKVMLTVQVNETALLDLLDTYSIPSMKSGINAIAQIGAIKPILMIIPSNSYCIKNGYYRLFGEEKIPDYAGLFQKDQSFRMVVSKISGIFAERGYPLKMLEDALNDVERSTVMDEVNETKRDVLDMVANQAKCDVIMRLDYWIERKGPHNTVSFNLEGVDAYTQKAITSASGSGQPFSNVSVDLALEAAVLNYIDTYSHRLSSYFNEIVQSGRETRLDITFLKDSSIDFSFKTSYLGEQVTLKEIIDYWIQKESVNGNYHLTNVTKNTLRYEQVRIPLFREQKLSKKKVPITAFEFYTALSDFLSQEFNLYSELQFVGLGSCRILIRR